MRAPLQPPHTRQLTPERSNQLREHLVTEISPDPHRSKEINSTLLLPETRSLRRLVAAFAVAAVAVSVFFFGVSPGEDLGSLPQIGQSSAKAAIEVIETDDTYEIVFVTLAEDVTEVEAELEALGLNIAIDFVPVSPSLENRLVVMESPAEGENLPEFVETADGATPPKLLVPKTFDQSASLVLGRPAQPGEEYVSAAISAQLPGEAFECIAIEGKTAGEAMTLLETVNTEIEWRPDLTDESYMGTVPDQYSTWYVAATVPVAQGRVLIFLVPNASVFDGSTPITADC